MNSHLYQVAMAMDELRQGKMVILTDDQTRENEGDIIFPAEIITPDIINFMIRYCSGIICLSLHEAQIKKLGLDYMVDPSKNMSSRHTPFTVSIEAKNGITTGVSAQDRATTILAAVNQQACAEDIVKPGHIFPLWARAGGVLERQGHTEGAIDLARLAGFHTGAVLCEVMNPDGTMAKGDELVAFAKKHQIKILAINDIVMYRRYYENLIEDQAETQLPLKKYGKFNISVIKEKFNADEHIVLTKNLDASNTPLVRIHSACFTGDLLGSERCDCQMQLDYSLQKISEEGGVFIYLAQEGRGIGLFNKIKAYALQDHGLDTIEANQQLGLPIDLREYYMAATILKSLNIHKMKVLTNNPHKLNNLQQYGDFELLRVPMPIFSHRHNEKYLATKKQKLNHFI